MFFCYDFLSTIAFIIILPFWLVAGIFKPKLVAGFKEKCGFYEKGNGKREMGKDFHFTFHASPFTVLFYGVSVGEVVAMENLIKKTREIYPDTNIIVMTGTQTGQEIAKKKLNGVANFITYFPFDFPFCINNMIKKIKPDAVFIMETELWPNFAEITNRKKIPTFIINARISDRTYKSYKKLSFIFGPILQKYSNIYPQSKHDAQKFISIGAKPETTEVMGNLKFDINAPDISQLNFKKPSDEKIILAGSTHFGEEEIILDVFDKLKNELPNLKLIIAPRHPERNEKVLELIQNNGLTCEKRSGYNNSLSTLPRLQASCLLLDTMGELGKFYSICDIAFIGGSFPQAGEDNFAKKGVGGHNPLEATIFNKPTVSGPSIHNFKDIYAILTFTDAGKVVKSSEELQKYLKKLLTDDKYYQKASQDCEDVFEQNKGALDFVLNVIKSIVL